MRNQVFNISYSEFRPIFLVCSICFCLFLLFSVELDSKQSLRDNWNYHNARSSLILNLDDDEDEIEAREAEAYYQQFHKNKRKANHHTQLNGGDGFIDDRDTLHEMESLHDKVEEMLMLIPPNQREQLIVSFPRPSPNRYVAGANILKLHELPADFR